MKIINKRDILEIFREDDVLSYFNHEDLQEIALHCVSYSDETYNKLNEIFNEEKNE